MKIQIIYIKPAEIKVAVMMNPFLRCVVQQGGNILGCMKNFKFHTKADYYEYGPSVTGNNQVLYRECDI